MKKHNLQNKYNEEKKQYRCSAYSIVFTIVQHFVLVGASFIASLPLISCVLTSLKTNQDLVEDDFFALPSQGININNYTQVLNSGFFKALLLTFFIVICSVLISSLLNAMVAYVLCRFEFRYKKHVFFLILFASFIPSLLMHIYIFQMMASIRLVNTILGYVIIISNIDILSIYIFSAYFSSISLNLDEAAILDGCSYPKVFLKIHLPNIKQAFLTVAIIKAIYVYNEYYLANLYLLDKSKYQTVTTLLYSFSSPFGTQYNVICAGVILAALPTIVLFIIFQKRIYNGLSITKK